MRNEYDFDSVQFFKHLTESNKLCRHYGFRFVQCSGLEGFDEALNTSPDAQALICVDDISQGQINLDNTPLKKSFRTVYMFMRHTIENDWMVHRQRCFDIMREIFRQFMSVLIRERTRLRLENIMIDDNVVFNEIDRYFYMGGACAWFQLGIDKFVSLELDNDEWLHNPIPPKISRLDVNTPRHLTTH